MNDIPRCGYHFGLGSRCILKAGHQGEHENMKPNPRPSADCAGVQPLSAPEFTSSQFDGHTEGPWKVVHRHPNEETRKHYCEIVPTNCMVFGYASVAVAEQYCAEAEEQKANARLIAAAPSLLADNKRLRELLAVALEWAKNGEFQPKYHRDHIISKLFEALKGDAR